MEGIRRMVVVSAVLLFLATAPVFAQAGSIRGVVVDAQNGKPLAGVTVWLDRTPADERTGKDGRFAVQGTGMETVLAARLPGYVPVKVDLPRGAGEVDAGTLSLRKVKTDEDRFAVQADDIRLHPQLAQFYDRKNERRAGTFLAPDDIARHPSARLVDIARRSAGMQRFCFVNRSGELDCGTTGDRGPTTIMNKPAEDQRCAARIWYYGMGPGEPSLDEVRMDQVLALEAYERPGSAPPEFQGGNCSIIVLWMRAQRE